MSNSGSSLAGEKSTSPEEIIRISADELAEHATNTVDVITESLSANELIDTGFVAKSETAAETWAKAIIGHGLEGSLGRKGESSSGNKGDTSSGRRSESSAGRPKDTSAQAGDAILGDTGAGYRDGIKAGHESAASPGHDAGVYIPDVSIEDEVLLSADKRDSFDSQDDAQYVEEKNDGANNSLEIFSFSSSSCPQSVSGQKKRPETLATSRWKKAYHLVKKHNAMKKKALSSPIGTGATLDGYALGFLSINSETRTILFKYLYNEKTEYLLLCIILSHIIVLILKAEQEWSTEFRPTAEALNVADIVLTSIYTAECVCRVITLGFYKSPHAYLRNIYNKLDFVIVVDSWVHMVRTLLKDEDAFLRLAVLRLFRALVIFRHLTFIGNVLAILDAIIKSIGTLELVIIFSFIFLFFYSAIGTQYFTGFLSFRCVRLFDGELTNPELFCNLKPSAHTDSCPGGQGLSCQRRPSPNYGATNFDNIASTFLILIQILSFEGWSLIMGEVRNNAATSAADTYFIVMTILGGYFLVNIYITAFSGVFLRVRQEHQLLLRKYRRDKAFSFANAISMASLLKEVIMSDDEKLSWGHRFRRKTVKLGLNFSRSLSRESSRLTSNITRAGSSYMRRMSSFGLTGIDDFSDILHDDQTRPPSFSRSLSRGAHFGRSLSRSVTMTTHFWIRKLSDKCCELVQSKVFTYGVLFLITLNTAGLCSYTTKMTPMHSESLQSLQKGMLACFCIEMTLRLFAGGFYAFVDQRMNVVDLLVICITIVHRFFLDFRSSEKFIVTVPNMLPIRMLRWFYVQRTRKFDKEGESTPILACILRSVGNLASVYFFLLIVIIIVSIFSMELWGGGMVTSDIGDNPRANHDTFLGAMLLWFSVATGESWVNQMWNVMRPEVKNWWMSPLLFVFYYLLTAIVILNLIIATILEETELTDYQKKLIQKRDHLKWLQVKHLHRTSSARGSDWLVTAIENFKHVKRRMSSMTVTSLSRVPSWSSQLPEVVQQSTHDIVPAAGNFQGSNPSEGLSKNIASDSAVNIPGSAAADDKSRASSSLGSQIPPTKASSNTAVDITWAGSDADGPMKARILQRRSSASSLTSHSPTTVLATPRRRLSQVSDAMFLRSGFTGAGLAVAGDDGNRTALQAALMVVVAEQEKLAAGAAVLKQAEEKLKSAEDTSVLKRQRSSSRISFVLSDFENVKEVEEKAAPWWMNERSLFLFHPDNKLRLLITRVVEHEYYRLWLILWIFGSMVSMIAMSPRGQYRVLKTAVPVFVFTDSMVFAMFFVDLLLKSAAYGFLLTREAYLEDPYNLLDLVNIIFHVMFIKGHEFSTQKEFFSKTTLILMAIRPFRYVNRFHGLRRLTTSLCRTLPAVTQILIFTVVVYAIFALIGMQLYAGRFRSCTDRTVIGHFDCVGMFYNDAGILAPRTWINPPFHFDTFGDSMLALFVASTFDNWLDYFLYTAMDSPKELGLSPRLNTNGSQAIFFVTFVCIGGFFILRMFVGVFIDQFGIMSGTKLLTERQKLWRDTNRLIQSLEPKRRPTPVGGCFLRPLCFKIVQSRRFELFMVFVIICDCIYLAAQTSYISQEGSDGAWVLHGRIDPRVTLHVQDCLTVIYFIEAAMKLAGSQLGDWWHDKWNLFELVIIVVATAGVTSTPPRYLGSSIGRAFICIRVIRIIRYFPALRIILSTVTVSLPSMLDIIFLMAIVLCSLSQIGTQVFYNIKDGICIRNGGEQSFETWISSFTILLQVTTLDNWSCLMIDITLSEPNCVPDVSSYASDCGFPVAGLVYMLVCICLTTYIFANLFIAQILDTITFGLLSEKAMLTPKNLVAYKELWAQDAYDPKCTGYIAHHKLKEFLLQLGYPLARGRKHGFVRWYCRIEYEIFHFRSAKGIGFRPLLETLCLYKVGARGLELPLRIERERHIHGIFQKGAAIKIQGLVRGFLQRKRNKRDKFQTTDTDNKKRYSEHPDDPPDIAFAEDHTGVLAGMGIAKCPVAPPHGRPPRPPRPPQPPQPPAPAAVDLDDPCGKRQPGNQVHSQ